MSAHVVIAGGGLAGLVAARALRRTTEVRITLIERDPRTGGKLCTERVAEAVVEAGPDSFLSTKPHALALCRELGIADELEGTIPRARRGFLRLGARLHALPEGLSGLVPARLSALLQSSVLSIPGRLRFAAELFVPPAPFDAEESVAAFARRRFGDEAYTRLIEPLAGGVFGGDADELSLRATFPALWEVEQRSGSVLAALHDRPGQRTGQNRTPFVAPRSGMQRIVDALRDELHDVDVHTDEPAIAVRTDGAAWRVDTERASYACDAIVLATPAPEAAKLVHDSVPSLAKPLAAIPHRAATVVHLAYAKSEVRSPLDGYGYLNSRSQGQVLACTWTTSKFAHRAPPDTVLLRLFLRGDEWADARVRPDSECERVAREELRDALGIRATPEWARITRWQAAMPQYTIGHADRLRAIDGAVTDRPGLFVTGNAYRGVGIPDTIAHATFVAERVRAHLAAAAGVASGGHA